MMKTVRNFLFRIYWRFEKKITPSLTHSQYEYEQQLFSNVSSNISWLDLGCGHQIFPDWQFQREKELTNRTDLLIGTDIDYFSLSKHQTIKLKVCSDISRLPFRDKCFDLVTANMVFEHLRDPIVQLKEIRRILKPGGKLIFHTPNKLGYLAIIARITPEFLKKSLIRVIQARKSGDVYPAFYKINSAKQITLLARLCKFDVPSIKFICSSAEFVVFPPVAVLELLWIRILLSNSMTKYRTNLIVEMTRSD